MKRNKTYRIHQKKKNQKRYFEKDFFFKRDSEERKARAIKFGDTPKIHQCQCCCNVRRSKWYNKIEKLSRQERQTINDIKEFNSDFNYYSQ